MNSTRTCLITICARAGSKGVPSKNIRPLLGKPLLSHTIEQALKWGHNARVVVSTDGPAIAEVAKQWGADVPFLRPAEMATDIAGKIPVVTHALRESERIFGETYDFVLDLDPTSPLRTNTDLDHGYETFQRSKADVCFSVVKARKNPYFNMVERDNQGKVQLVKTPNTSLLGRQAAPLVWDMNASIYFYSRHFLLSDPATIWGGLSEFFEMAPESAFDIDQERDFVLVEALMQHHLKEQS